MKYVLAVLFSAFTALGSFASASAGNPHTPLDVLGSIIESVDENKEELVEEAL